jgi:hypothetical protein
MSPEEIARPLITLWSVLFLLFLPAYWITRDWNWTGILLVVIVLGFFSSTIFAYSYSITIVSILGLLWGAHTFLLKRKLRLKHVHIVLNAVSLIAIALSLAFLYPLLNTIPASYYNNTWDVVHAEKYVQLDPNIESKPDIYFIILDGYGRKDILQELYNFDNSEFIDYLEHKGFNVSERSRANYPKTVLSVTSTLNMDYIESFAPQLEDSSLLWLMSPWLDHNLVRTSLEKIGYSSVSISSDWSITDNPTTDYYFKSHPIILSEFDRYILGVTPLHTFLPVMQKFASTPTFEAHRHSQLNNFQALVESTDIPGPKFVFAHIILPHPPFVFSSTGAPLNPGYSYTLNDADASSFPYSEEEYRDQYVGQTQFLNNQLEQVIESILQRSKHPPIIILQADHGPRMLTDAFSAENTCLAEDFSTFSAQYLPGVEAGTIPEDITSVNLFRIILNKYFDASLPLLKNVQYFPRQELGNYRFENVSYMVDSGQNCNLDQEILNLD